MFGANSLQFNKYLINQNFFIGQIIDLDDKEKFTFAKVNVLTLTDEMKEKELPWYEIQLSGSEIKLPQKNDWVWLENRYGTLDKLVITGVINTGKAAEEIISDKTILNSLDTNYITSFPNAQTITYPYSTENMPLIQGASGCEFIENDCPYDNPDDCNECKDYEGPEFPNGVKIFYSSEKKVWYMFDEAKDYDNDLKTLLENKELQLLIDTDKFLYNRYNSWKEQFPMYTTLNAYGCENWKNIVSGSSIQLVKQPPFKFANKDCHHPNSATQIVAKAGMAAPQSKYKIKNREYWKQNTIFSPTKKSRLEFDDNDNYERMLLWFNNGNTFLEFSEAEQLNEFYSKNKTNIFLEDFIFLKTKDDFTVESKNGIISADVLAVLSGTGKAVVQGKTKGVMVLGAPNVILANNERSGGFFSSSGPDESDSLKPIMLKQTDSTINSNYAIMLKDSSEIEAQMFVNALKTVIMAFTGQTQIANKLNVYAFTETDSVLAQAKLED